MTMGLRGAAVAILGDGAWLGEALASRLRGSGASVERCGPADYLFHLALDAGGSAGPPEEEVERPLRAAASRGGRLRHICLVRGLQDPEPSSLAWAHRLAFEDGLRFLAAAEKIPLATLRVDAARVSAPAAAAAAEELALRRLAGEHSLGAWML